MKRLLKRFSSTGSANSSTPLGKPAGAGYIDSNAIDPQREAITSPAVFYRTLESLLARDKYLLAQNPAKYSSLADGVFLEGDSPNVPWILKKFVLAALQEEVVTTEGIFRLGGSTKLVKETREIIDKSGDVDFKSVQEVDIPAIGSIIKAFLRDMPEGVVPVEYFAAFASADESLPDLKSAIQQLPQPNLDVFIFLCYFILRIARRSDVNKMGTPNLVIVFAPCMFRCPSAPTWSSNGSPEQFLVESIQITKILCMILDNFDVVFEGMVPKKSPLKSRSKNNTPNDSRILKSNVIDDEPISPSKRSVSDLVNVPDVSWTSEGRNSPELLAHPSPTPSQSEEINSMINKTVGKVLFGKYNTEAGEPLLKPSDVSMELDKIQIKMVVAGSSTAISPGSIKGSHQSVLDELKDKINRRRSISEISSKSVDLSVALAGSTSTSNPSKTRPISVDMATHSNISEKYAKEREESIGRVNFIATRPESRALMSQLNTKFRKVETSAPSISDDVDDGSEIDDQMKHGVLNENKTGKLGLMAKSRPKPPKRRAPTPGGGEGSPNRVLNDENTAPAAPDKSPFVTDGGSLSGKVSDPMNLDTVFISDSNHEPKIATNQPKSSSSVSSAAAAAATSPSSPTKQTTSPLVERKFSESPMGSKSNLYESPSATSDPASLSKPLSKKKLIDSSTPESPKSRSFPSPSTSLTKNHRTLSSSSSSSSRSPSKEGSLEKLLPTASTTSPTKKMSLSEKKAISSSFEVLASIDRKLSLENISIEKNPDRKNSMSRTNSESLVESPVSVIRPLTKSPVKSGSTRSPYSSSPLSSQTQLNNSGGSPDTSSPTKRSANSLSSPTKQQQLVPITQIPETASATAARLSNIQTALDSLPKTTTRSNESIGAAQNITARQKRRLEVNTQASKSLAPTTGTPFSSFPFADTPLSTSDTVKAAATSVTIGAPLTSATTTLPRDLGKSTPPSVGSPSQQKRDDLLVERELAALIPSVPVTQLPREEASRLKKMCKDLYEKVKNGREAMTSSPNSTTGGFIYDGDMKKDVRIYKGLKAYLKVKTSQGEEDTPLLQTPFTPQIFSTLSAASPSSSKTTTTTSSKKPVSAPSPSYASPRTSKSYLNKLPSLSAAEESRRKIEAARREHGWSTDIDCMSFVDVAEEKNMLKNELAYLKSVYGKSAGGGGGGVDDGGGDGGVETIAVGGKKGKLTASKSDKDILKEIYQRYCKLRTVSKPESQQSASATTPLIPLNTPNVVSPLSATKADVNSPISSPIDTNKRLKELRVMKRDIQILLRNFQDEFTKENGRPVQNATDRDPIKHEYQRYKDIKNEILELEAKLAKNNQ